MGFLAEQINKVTAFSGTAIITTHTERLIDECESIQASDQYDVELRIGIQQVHIGLLKVRLEQTKAKAKGG